MLNAAGCVLDVARWLCFASVIMEFGIPIFEFKNELRQIVVG
jgi:hypothetical protein